MDAEALKLMVGSAQAQLGPVEHGISSHNRDKEKPKPRRPESRERSQKALEKIKQWQKQTKKGAWTKLIPTDQGEVRAYFAKASIPVELWGQGHAKTLEFLLMEQSKGLCVLQTNAQGEVRRHMRICKVRIVRGTTVLIEAYEQTLGQAPKPLWQFLSVKCKMDEEPSDAALRGMQNELGQIYRGEVAGPKIGNRTEVTHLTKFAPSYPGLPGFCEYFTVEADGSCLPDEDFETVDSKTGNKHQWVWMSRDEWEAKSKAKMDTFKVDKVAEAIAEKKRAEKKKREALVKDEWDSDSSSENPNQSNPEDSEKKEKAQDPPNQTKPDELNSHDGSISEGVAASPGSKRQLKMTHRQSSISIRRQGSALQLSRGASSKSSSLKILTKQGSEATGLLLELPTPSGLEGGMWGLPFTPRDSFSSVRNIGTPLTSKDELEPFSEPTGVVEFLHDIGEPKLLNERDMRWIRRTRLAAISNTVVAAKGSPQLVPHLPGVGSGWMTFREDSNQAYKQTLAQQNSSQEIHSSGAKTARAQLGNVPMFPFETGVHSSHGFSTIGSPIVDVGLDGTPRPVQGPSQTMNDVLAKVPAIARAIQNRRRLPKPLQPGFVPTPPKSPPIRSPLKTPRNRTRSRGSSSSSPRRLTRPKSTASTPSSRVRRDVGVTDTARATSDGTCHKTKSALEPIYMFPEFRAAVSSSFMARGCTPDEVGGDRSGDAQSASEVVHNANDFNPPRLQTHHEDATSDDHQIEDLRTNDIDGQIQFSKSSPSSLPSREPRAHDTDPSVRENVNFTEKVKSRDVASPTDSERDAIWSRLLQKPVRAATGWETPGGTKPKRRIGIEGSTRPHDCGALTEKCASWAGARGLISLQPSRKVPKSLDRDYQTMTSLGTRISVESWMQKHSVEFTENEVFHAKMTQVWRDLFRLLDVDRDGKVDSFIMPQVLQQLGADLTREQVANLIKQVTVLAPGRYERTGTLNWDRFYQVMELSGAKKKIIKPKFYPSIKDLEPAALAALPVLAKSYRMRKEFANEIYKIIDFDNSGTVDTEEIARLISFMPRENQDRLESFQATMRKVAERNMRERGDAEIDIEDFQVAIDSIPPDPAIAVAFQAAIDAGGGGGSSYVSYLGVAIENLQKRADLEAADAAQRKAQSQARKEAVERKQLELLEQPKLNKIANLLDICEDILIAQDHREGRNIVRRYSDELAFFTGREPELPEPGQY